jgi:hypothetical protein
MVQVSIGMMHEQVLPEMEMPVVAPLMLFFFIWVMLPHDDEPNHKPTVPPVSVLLLI